MGYRRNITVPFEIVELEDNSYHILIPVTINHISGDVIIDTGASVTVADRNLFTGTSLSDSPGLLQSGSITGEIGEIRIMIPEKIEIGGYRLPFSQLALIDFSYINRIYSKSQHRKIIGLLGSDFCIRHGAVIDYRQKTIRFYVRPLS